MTHRIVVVGAGYSGLKAALRLARRTRGAEVVLVNAVDRFVERVRLHQVAAGDNLPEHALSAILRGTGVELVVTRVLAIDPDQRELRLDAAGPLAYDTMVHALGSGPDANGVPGVAEHAIPIADLDGALELRKRATDLAAESGTLTVVGGGPVPLLHPVHQPRSS